MNHTYFTAFAYECATGKTRRASKRYPTSAEARAAAEQLVPQDGPWEWVVGGRGAARPTDEEAGSESGEWQLVVRPHRAPNLRAPK